MVLADTKQGKLNGKLESLASGKTFASFRGIPYARPPIGELRFQAPQPPFNWNGVRDATNHGPFSPHWEMGTKKILEGDEDCLFLNVYTPSIKGKASVMVWFHGGGFQSGSGDSTLYGPDYLLEQGVVLVTINYRLEVLGFLCLETEEVPGNAGLKDQVMALKWVQENISNFGGDPGNVTIFGESAGGASVTYHMISSLSRGLFHKVISQSGCLLNEWTIAYDNLERAFRLGRYLGFETESVDELLKFLRSVPAVKLVQVTYRILTKEEKKRGLPIYFCPVIEKHPFKSFLSECPVKLLKEERFPKVPVLIGYNNGEGIVFIKEVNKRSKLLHQDFSIKMPRDIAKNVPSDVLKTFADKMKQFYYQDKEIGEDTIQATVDMESDYKFIYGILNFVKIVSRTTPVYLYRFSADTSLNFMKNMTRYKHAKGASHADDLFYIFKTWSDLVEGSEEWKAVYNITRLWTNFAKYGDPTPMEDQTISSKWKAASPSELNYLEIDSILKTGIDPEKERFEFWTQMYKEFEEYLNIKCSL